jgi:hypothetical protein
MSVKRFWGRGAFFLLFTGFFFFSALAGYSQDLGIGAADMRIEQRVDGGYHLFIRKKPEWVRCCLPKVPAIPR